MEGPLIWIFLALACTPAEVTEWWKMPEQVRFVSPSAHTPVVGDAMPILVRLPRRLQHGSVSLRLDGQPVEVGGILRQRWWSGKKTDFIGELSTAGLAPGLHTLSLVSRDGAGEDWSVDRRFTVGLRPDRLRIEVVDEAGAPRSARVEVFDEMGAPFHTGNLGDALADPSQRDAVRSSVFVSEGTAQVRLPPGRYTLLASGGIRDGTEEREIQVPEDRTVRLTVPRLIRTPDEVMADLHVHTAMSGDAFTPDSRRMASLIAGGVEVGVITEHNRVRDPAPALALLGLGSRLMLVPGVEFRIGPAGDSIGHGNAFPLQPGPALPIPGSRTPAEVVAGWRDHGQQHPLPGQSGEVLIQLNHPRGIQFWPDRDHQRDAHGLFSELGLEAGLPLGAQTDPRLYTPDPERGERIVDVDALEILNRFSLAGWRSVRQDWFALMNQGWFPTGTGNSDSHSVELERPGFPINLVRIAPPDRRQPDALVAAIRAGRVGVSSGPIVRMIVQAEDGPMALPGDTLTGPLDAVWVEVEVLAVPWVPVPEVRVVVDGEVYHQVVLPRGTAEGGPLRRGMWRWRIPLDGDTWILAEAGWAPERLDRPTEGRYPRVAPGHVPIGFTNPVRVDADGDGRWTPRVDPRLSEEDDSGTFDRDDTARED